MSSGALAISPSLLDRGEPELRHLCDISIDLELQAIPSPAGARMLFAVRRGICRGARLNGSFRQNSGDWLTFGSDNIGRIDVRATIETDDGQLIYMTNTGRIVLTDDTIARLGAGGHLASDQLYARSCPLFETGSEDYAWLNGMVSVAINEIALDHVDYRVFEVL